MYHGWSGGWAPGGYMFGLPWGGLFMGVLFTALIVLMVFAIVRMGKLKKNDPEGGTDRGMDILVSRFSRGEIDAQTFRSMKAELETKN